MKLAQLDNKRLENSLVRTEKYLEELAGLESWMDEVHDTHLHKDYTVHTEQELTDCRVEFKVSMNKGLCL